MSTPIRITPENQPPFPCWLLMRRPVNGTRWVYSESVTAEIFREVGPPTHWHPDQPAVPTERPGEHPCTCHPDDAPPVPCPHQYALNECRNAAPSVPAWAVEAAREIALRESKWFFDGTAELVAKWSPIIARHAPAAMRGEGGKK